MRVLQNIEREMKQMRSGSIDADALVDVGGLANDPAEFDEQHSPTFAGKHPSGRLASQIQSAGERQRSRIQDGCIHLP